MSVMKSDREWNASAIIAALCPSTPATNLKMTSSALPALPTRVTLYMLFSLSIILKSGAKLCIIWQKW